LIVIEEAQNLQIKFLELEKEKLEKALRERSAEADEWQNKATEFEERFLTGNRIQFELQSYERRIQKAIDDNADKAKEFEDNQLVLA
jgi:predicted transcriptional regulator